MELQPLSWWGLVVWGLLAGAGVWMAVFPAHVQTTVAEATGLSVLKTRPGATAAIRIAGIAWLMLMGFGSWFNSRHVT